MIRALCALFLAGLALAACRGEAEHLSGEPALWEIAGPRGTTEGWLFGTAHALPPGTTWRTARFDRAFAKAGTLVLEIANPGDTDGIGKVFSELSQNSRQPPLEDRVDPSLRPQLAALLPPRGSPARARIDRLETWAAALTVAQLSASRDRVGGADAALVRRFGNGRVVELEGAAAQLAIFDALPEEDQRDLLEAVLRESRYAEAHEDQLTAAWLHGDLAALERFTNRGMLADPELREALLVARNRAWASRIEQLLQSGDRPFVAVGAAHLVGPDSVTALLENSGYSIRRIQ